MSGTMMPYSYLLLADPSNFVPRNSQYFIILILILIFKCFSVTFLVLQITISVQLLLAAIHIYVIASGSKTISIPEAEYFK